MLTAQQTLGAECLEATLIGRPAVRLSAGHRCRERNALPSGTPFCSSLFFPRPSLLALSLLKKAEVKHSNRKLRCCFIDKKKISTN